MSIIIIIRRTFVAFLENNQTVWVEKQLQSTSVMFLFPDGLECSNESQDDELDDFHGVNKAHTHLNIHI